MKLGLPDDSRPIVEMFEGFFAAESTPARVRAAEPLGFDAALWRELVAVEAPFMRLSADAGGGGMSLFDSCLMMEQAGRRLASVPLAEVVVALRILGQLGGQTAREWIDKMRDGETVLSIAPCVAKPGETQLVVGAAVAKGVLTFDGREVAIEVPAAPLAAPATLGAAAIGVFTPGAGARHVISSKADAANVWAAGIEEWKLLTSAALIGLSKEALSMAAAYACERIAFGQPIGANQGIAHPLAIDAIDADGGGLLLWWTLRAIADGHPEAAATVSMLFWWSARTATNCVAHSLHTFGGYGLSVAETERRARLLERLFPVLTETPASYPLWRNLVVAHGVQGVQVHDSRLVAIMQTYGVTHILTLNSADFARYYATVVAVTPPIVP